MLKRGLLHAIEEGFIKIFLFAIAVSLAFITSDTVYGFIHPDESHGILNLYTASGVFSPEQNYATLIWIALASVIFFKGIEWLQTRYSKIFRLFVIILLVPFFLLSTTFMPQIKGYEGNIDMFHHGEQLSPGNTFNKGGTIFDDMFVLHGTGEDVIVPALALKLAPHKDSGIGTYLFITTALKLVSAALFIFLVSKLFKNDAVFLAVSAWFTLSATYGAFYYARDIFLWLFVLGSLYLLTTKRPRVKLLYFGLGILCGTALFYAIDRGLVIVASTGVIVLISLFMKRLPSGDFRFNTPRKFVHFTGIIYVALGFVVTQLLTLLATSPRQYGDFLKTYLADIPQYQGLLFNYPLPRIETSNFLLWLPVILLPVGVLMIIKLIHQGTLKKIDNRLVFAIVILIAGTLLLRGGYGRTDSGHIAYATPLLLLAVFYVVSIYIVKINMKSSQIWMPLLVLTLIAIPVPTISFDRFASFMNARIQPTSEFMRLPVKPDNTWVPENVGRVVDYIKSNSSTSDKLFVFTNEPLYYYLADRQNSTRFYISWFADPAPLEQEMLQDLQDNPPKMVIYTSDSIWDKPDGISMQKRTPDIDAWLTKQYPRTVMIGDVRILLKE